MSKLYLFSLVLSCLFLSAGLPSAMALEKAELSDALAQKGEMSAEEAEAQIRLVFATISEQLQEGKSVTIRGFGRFYLQARKARTMRLPSSGKRVKIPARNYPRFSSSEVLKRAIFAEAPAE